MLNIGHISLLSFEGKACTDFSSVGLSLRWKWPSSVKFQMMLGFRLFELSV